MPQADVIIVGAGPAGLTAALECQKAGYSAHIIEADPEYVGGISRTVRQGGFKFDIGGHRFFTKNKEIREWWHRQLGPDMLKVQRLSRIFYDEKFFKYPLCARNAIGNLGIWRGMRCGLSYLKAQLRPIKNERSFEDWVVNRFGRELFSIFFKSYTEKVWGIPCHEISADWAAQRIKALDFRSAVWNAMMPSFLKKRGRKTIKTLIEEFDYPRQGPGMMWERARDQLLANGGNVEMGFAATAIQLNGDRVASITAHNKEGEEKVFKGDSFILSMPLRETIQCMQPQAPDHVLQAANALQYRDFLIVALYIEEADLFPDNWIYIHDPSVKVGRIQNFKNWSAEMVENPSQSCVGMEYFCFEKDDFWNRKDEDLIRFATCEIEKLGLADAKHVRGGAVVRVEKAYPVYDQEYQNHVSTIRRYLASLPNLQVIGRNGMHKYNNQDHSMLTGLLAARNLDGGQFDLWRVNTDAEYHEEERAQKAQQDFASRAVPSRAAASVQS